MTNRTRPHTVTHISCRGEREDGMWDGRRDATTNQENAHEIFPSSNTNKTTSFSQTQILHWKRLQPAQQAGVSHFILEYKRLQQRWAGPIPIRICRTVQHAPLRRVPWISLQAHTVGCRGHRDLLGNSPHYKPHPHNSVKVYDIIRPCHRRALQSEPKCTCYSDLRGEARRCMIHSIFKCLFAHLDDPTAYRHKHN